MRVTVDEPGGRAGTPLTAGDRLARNRKRTRVDGAIIMALRSTSLLLLAALGLGSSTAAGCRHELAKPFCVEDPSDPRCELELDASADGGADADTNAEGGDPTHDTALPPCPASGTCARGSERTVTCGKCGSRIEKCDPESCSWLAGACTGEGVCDPGSTESLAGSCPSVIDGPIRRCSAMCKWEPTSCSPKTGWRAIATPPSGFVGRARHTAVWTGEEMIVFGGGGGFAPTPVRADGAAYTPSTDSWSLLPAEPTATGRWQHTAVWTGSEMIVWGGARASGNRADGAAFDPVAKTWRALAAAPLSARNRHGAVWSTTTNQMLVWGGSVCDGYCSDGAAFDPKTNSWASLPAAPIAGRKGAVVAWLDDAMIIWGGESPSGWLVDGARYDPASRVWTKLPTPPVTFKNRDYPGWAVGGGSLYLVHGFDYVSMKARADAARYSPTSGWTLLPTLEETVVSPPARLAWHAFFSDRLFVWSGAVPDADGAPLMAPGGAIYDSVGDAWSPLDSTGAPSSRMGASVVWTGAAALVWGGLKDSSILATDGAVYVP